ncbi:AAA-like domain-containing protein [Aerosakkonema funiforme]|uniref:AAA-like domain-containing protein n=1 Tax=Aerosakkonema funiforme TaxID=1246630 RepID=UPI0035B7CD2A
MHQYQVGGSLPPNSLIYVRRKADTELCDRLKAGEFCYVLAPRQAGKSSLMVQTIDRLQGQGIKCVTIYTSNMGTPTDDEPQWYASIINTLVNTLELSEEINVRSWWENHHHLSSVQRLSEFIEKELLVRITTQLVICFDEIDSVLRLKFPVDNFFGLIRSCYEKRARDQKYNRLTFAVFGVATPLDLIQDKKRSPFDIIGREIKLEPFQDEDEANNLRIGLDGKVHNTRVALKEILNWTGGQPFLTQKICKLIQDWQYDISEGLEADEIQYLVTENIIKNWETQDKPEHLQNIPHRLIQKPIQRTISRLKLYQQILEQREVDANGSLEQIELELSGLVVKQSGKLKVHNKIYQAVFHAGWVGKQLDVIRPYADRLADWIASNRQDTSHLLRGKELQDGLSWAFDKNLSGEERQFLKASQNLEKQELQKADRSFTLQKSIIWAIVAVFGLAIIYQLGSKIIPIIPHNQSNSSKTNNISNPNNISERLSSGERRLFREKSNLDLDRGTETFKSANYPEAEKLFETAKNSAPNDPESQIYLNNTIARQKGSPFKLAVVIPVDNQAESAREILRGVADAQTKFNNSGGVNNRLLEIIIANDGNEEPVAAKIAHQLANDPVILGVIGHNSSNASDAALPYYEKVGLAMISPTSTSTDLNLKSKVFFRTVPSDKAMGEKLAEYAITNLKLDKVVIFSDSGSYSTSLRRAFDGYFTQQGRSLTIVDLRSSDVEKQLLQNIEENKVGAAILLPSVDTTSVAISVAKANAKLPESQRLKLLGGDALYNPNTLIDGGNAVKGLVLAVSWFDRDTSYAANAQERWGGNISWRTASSYDATQAFIKALSDKASRSTVLENLRKVQLSEQETSGYPLKFESNGDRNGKALLVEVSEGAPAPKNSKYGFKLIETSGNIQE